jgi:hypothetical protein
LGERVCWQVAVATLRARGSTGPQAIAYEIYRVL